MDKDTRQVDNEARVQAGRGVPANRGEGQQESQPEEGSSSDSATTLAERLRKAGC